MYITERMHQLSAAIDAALEYVGSANYADRETHAKYQSYKNLMRYFKGEGEIKFEDMGNTCRCPVCQENAG